MPISEKMLEQFKLEVRKRYITEAQNLCDKQLSPKVTRMIVSTGGNFTSN